MSKPKILVIYGGWGPEREVSIKSAEYVLQHIDRNKYKVIELLLNDASDLIKIQTHKPDFVFIVLHGTHGEDGNIQAYLEMLGIPYSSVGPLQSQICMDKFVFKQILKTFKIPTIRDIVIRIRGNKHQIWLGTPNSYQPIRDTTSGKVTTAQIIETIEQYLKFPVFIKPNNTGSSVGVSKVKSAQQVDQAIQKALDYSDTVIIEKAIEGNELTVGFVGDHILPPVLIKPKKSEFFDYSSKYEPGGAEEICPAPIDTETTKQLNTLVRQIKDALKLDKYARIDFMQDASTKAIYPLEVNTIPGMTQTSLLPQEARAYGWSDEELIERIIELGLENQ